MDSPRARHPREAVLLLLLLMLLWDNAGILAAPLVPALYILGDSLVDPGNNNYIPLALAKANFPYNGIDFPQGFTGRFCNGRTTFDIVTTLLGFTRYPPAYLDPAVQEGNNLLEGVNFASAAAGILDSTGLNYAERVPLNKQLDFLEHNTLPTLLNDYFDGDQVQFQAYLAKSLWTVVVGSNDYINNYLLPKSPLRNLSPQAYQQLLVTSFHTQLERLRSLGARKIVVAGVGPLGCIPSQLSKNPQTNGACVAPVNQLVVNFNAAVKAMLEGLNAKYADSSTFLFANTYDTVFPLIKNPSLAAAQGFQVTNVGCCGAGAYNGVTPCAYFLGATVCSDRSKYIFWDAFHPTDGVNNIIANQIFSGGPEAISPINVRQLAAI